MAGMMATRSPTATSVTVAPDLDHARRELVPERLRDRDAGQRVRRHRGDDRPDQYSCRSVPQMPQ